MLKELSLFNDLVNELLQDEVKNPVLDPIPFEELYDTIDLELRDEGAVDEEFVKVLRQVVMNTPRTATKMFFNQLFGGRNGRAVLGDLLSVILNNSLYTYKVGGPMIGLEKNIVKELAKKIGYDPNKAEGLTAPGGSMTNLMGLIMARDYKDEDAKYDGISKKLIIYTSTESHYSTPKNVAFAGVGRNNIRFIQTDEQGRMLASHLETEIKLDIEKGNVPCMVCATAGTTVLAAFDPMRAIGEICKKYDVWMHIDGAYCGSVIFSEKYKKLIDGCEMADSFTINAHKMLSTPLSCSFIVVKDMKYLYDSFSNDASYLYQTDGDEINPGKISMQCGRKNDALKFWTLWKSIGTNGLEAMVDHQFDLAQHGRDYVASNKDYTLYNSGDSISVCFNYKGIDPKELCNKLYEEGEIMVGFGRFKDQEFVRFVTVNAGNEKEDIDNFFKEMEAFAAKHF